ncbi:MAG: DoxX family protein [Patescibacteria group bacterium]|nr:DoxX family protein [Patescibacteria group bacterium]MDE1945709.1 DoxX family protein [Patescibacteria group bacterium]
MLLNVFPGLLTYGIIAPLILRIVLGLIAIDLGFLKLGKERREWRELFDTIHFRPSHVFVKLLALIEIVGGIMLILGAYTQIVAIVFAIAFFSESVVEYREESLEKRNFPFYMLLLAISLALVFLGAGAFALDSML